MLTSRKAGILLHPTSLPGSLDQGDLGPNAYYFVHFLKDCGFRIWQTLPLGPTHSDRSPYNCVSAHAGNPLLISAHSLYEEGWLDTKDIGLSRQAMLVSARQHFSQRANPADREAFEAFTDASRYWLEDYALYQAIRDAEGQIPWYDWPAPLRHHETMALKKVKHTLVSAMTQTRFEQFLFFRQWGALKKYANAQGIDLFGDMAIFVAHDSADVWAHQSCFQLNEQGQPTFVAGVPPDYFSEEGQRWGNPLYDWENNESGVISLWIDRMRTQTELFDLIRIDHFRGLESHWAIPADEQSPKLGAWVKTPGDKLLSAIRQKLGSLSLIAEDLGFITEAVDQLRRAYGLPGMHILQFGFDGDPHNRHLLHAHDLNNVVYTGTHDNDTTLGWFNTLSQQTKDLVLNYFGYPNEPMPWPIVRFAMASVANLVILPLQDALGLDSHHRMNRPGTPMGNWQWRFTWDQIPEPIANRLASFTKQYGRL